MVHAGTKTLNPWFSDQGIEKWALVDTSTSVDELSDVETLMSVNELTGLASIAWKSSRTRTKSSGMVVVSLSKAVRIDSIGGG